MKKYIQLATISDTIGVSNCNKLCLPISYSPIEYGYYILSPYHEVIIIKYDNKIVGYLIGGYDNKIFHIMSIGVLKEYRNQGLGKLLLDFAEKIVKPYVNTLSLYVHVENASAINFYKNNGFKFNKRIKNYYRSAMKVKSSSDALHLMKQI